MKLKDQCCTREQGQRLVELGIKPEVLFWWMPSMSGPHGEYVRYGYHGNNQAPAFNSSELGELLPERFITYKSTDRYDSAKGAYYVSSQRVSESPRIYAATEAQVRAAMLIHLLENNLIICHK